MMTRMDQKVILQTRMLTLIHQILMVTLIQAIHIQVIRMDQAVMRQTLMKVAHTVVIKYKTYHD
jgi:hypothetical protein